MRSPLTVLAILLPTTVVHAEVFVEANASVDVNVDVNVHVVQPEPVVEPVVLVEQPPPPRRSSLRGDRWEAGLAIAGGSFQLAELSGAQIAVRGSLGRQVGPLRLGVDGSVGKWSGTVDLHDAMGGWDGWLDLSGEVKRVGATARLRGVFDPQDPACPCEIGAYVEGGVGRSWITATGGTRVVERPDYLLGAGIEIAGGRYGMGGADLGVRLVASPSVDPNDATHDLSIIAHLGAVFGR